MIRRRLEFSHEADRYHCGCEIVEDRSLAYKIAGLVAGERYLRSPRQFSAEFLVSVA